MGMCANAEFCFGIYIEPEHDVETYETLPPFDDEDGFDLETLLVKTAGLADPYDNMPDLEQLEAIDRMSWKDREAARTQWDKGHPEWIAQREAYWEAKHELEARAPIETAHFGHCEDPDSRVILALKGTRSESGDTWSPAPFDPAKLTVDEDRLQEAIKFCDEHNLGDFRKAEWLLYASYG